MQGKVPKFVQLAVPVGSDWVKKICSNGTIMGWGRQVAYDFIISNKPIHGDDYYDPHLKCAFMSVPDLITCHTMQSITYGGMKFCVTSKGAKQDICKVR